MPLDWSDDNEFPDLEDLDIYELAEWASTEAPDWMDGLSLETMARLDYYDVPPVDEWSSLVVSHGEDSSDPWEVTITTDDGREIVLDFSDDWVGAWLIYDWADEFDVDVERDVDSYSDTPS